MRGYIVQCTILSPLTLWNEDRLLDIAYVQVIEVINAVMACKNKERRG